MKLQISYSLSTSLSTKEVGGNTPPTINNLLNYASSQKRRMLARLIFVASRHSSIPSNSRLMKPSYPESLTSLTIFRTSISPCPKIEPRKQLFVNVGNHLPSPGCSSNGRM